MSPTLLTSVIFMICVVPLADAFALAFGGVAMNRRSSDRRLDRQLSWKGNARLYASSRDEEIARLEAEIRKLRDEAASDDIEGEDSAEAAFAAAQALADKKRLLAQVRGKDMLLTEGALIQENILENEGSTVGIAPAILGAVLAAAVIAFSQVPIGQEDLSRYSVQAGPTVSTKIDLGDINPDRPSP